MVAAYLLHRDAEPRRNLLPLREYRARHRLACIRWRPAISARTAWSHSAHSASMTSRASRSSPRGSASKIQDGLLGGRRERLAQIGRDENGIQVCNCTSHEADLPSPIKELERSTLGRHGHEGHVDRPRQCPLHPCRGEPGQRRHAVPVDGGGDAGSGRLDRRLLQRGIVLSWHRD